MLVLSRRSKEKISFPEVGITIHFIRVHSGTAKLGIDAPMHIQIVRDEVDNDAAQAAEAARKELLRLPRQVRHAIRNELHTISVGLHLFKEQTQLELEEDAQETFETIMQSIKTIDANDVLRRPGAQNPRVPAAKPAPILVVEHQANEREMLASFLRHQGYDVATAADGNEASEYLAQNETLAVILLDMKMPHRDGATTVRDIRGDPRHLHTRVYAISDTSPEENGIKTGRDGVDRWFPKPLNIQFLIDALASEVEGASSPGGAQSTSNRGHASP